MLLGYGIYYAYTGPTVDARCEIPHPFSAHKPLIDAPPAMFQNKLKISMNQLSGTAEAVLKQVLGDIQPQECRFG